MKRIFAVALSAAVVGSAVAAPSRNAFKPGYFTGLNVVQTGNSFNVSLGAAATFYYLGTTYQVRDIFGFYQVGSASNTFTNATARTSPSNWSFDGATSRRAADVVGWTDNGKKNVVAPGGAAKTFAFNGFSTTTGQTFQSGFHVRVAGSLPGGGDTMFVTGNGNAPAPAPVPEPATMAVLGLGALGLIRRKRAA